MTDIRNLADPDLRKMIKKRPIALLPIGSLEQHGPHLPISVDSDIVTEVAKRVAKNCNFLLLPTITYGVSFEHAPFFNLSVSAKNLQEMVNGIIDSLAQNRFSSLIILNGHHGNHKPLKILESRLGRLNKKKIKVYVLSYWHFMSREFDHAGFVETSLMLAISNKANMKLAKKGFTTDNISAKKKEKISKLASTHFIKATKTGVWGDPTGATKIEGKRILSEVIRNITKTVSKMAY